MKNFKCIILALVLMAPMALQAQETPEAPAAESIEAPLASTASAGKDPVAKLVDSAKKNLENQAEEAAIGEIPTEATDVVADAVKVYGDWKTSGWMAGLLALISLFMNLLRFGPVDDFFRSKQLIWLKPVLAAALGAATAGLGAGMSGAGVGPSLMAGVMAGLGSVGLYEVAKRRKVENRAK